MGIRLSKGPNPPNLLPTAEEQARGTVMSDDANDWSHYLDGPKQVQEYHATGRLKAKTPLRVIQLISYFGGR